MMVPSEMLALKWNNHPSTFLGVLSELLDKASYCDATVACQGRLYSVHRFVLSACSEYFKDIFAAVGDRHAVIVLKDVTFEVFTDLLKYMYQGEINIEQEKLAKLISAAEYLKIKGLAEPQDEEHGGESDGVIDIDCVSSSSTGGRRASSERRGGSAVKPSGNRGKGYYGDKRKLIKGYEVSESGSCKRKRNDSTPLSSKSQSYMSDDSSGTPEILSDPVKRSVKEMFVEGGPSSHAKGALKTNTKPVVASATECDVKSVNESEKENYFAHDPGVKTEPEEVFVLEDTSSNCEYDGVDDTAFPLSAAEGRDGKGRVTPPAAGDDRLQPNRDRVSFGTADVEMLDDYSDTAPERYNDDDFEVRGEEDQVTDKLKVLSKHAETPTTARLPPETIIDYIDIKTGALDQKRPDSCSSSSAKPALPSATGFKVSSAGGRKPKTKDCQACETKTTSKHRIIHSCYSSRGEIRKVWSPPKKELRPKNSGSSSGSFGECEQRSKSPEFDASGSECHSVLDQPNVKLHEEGPLPSIGDTHKMKWYLLGTNPTAETDSFGGENKRDCMEDSDLKTSSSNEGKEKPGCIVLKRDNFVLGRTIQREPSEVKPLKAITGTMKTGIEITVTRGKELEIDEPNEAKSCTDVEGKLMNEGREQPLDDHKPSGSGPKFSQEKRHHSGFVGNPSGAADNLTGAADNLTGAADNLTGAENTLYGYKGNRLSDLGDPSGDDSSPSGDEGNPIAYEAIPFGDEGNISEVRKPSTTEYKLLSVEGETSTVEDVTLTAEDPSTGGGKPSTGDGTGKGKFTTGESETSTGQDETYALEGKTSACEGMPSAGECKVSTAEDKTTTGGAETSPVEDKPSSKERKHTGRDCKPYDREGKPYRGEGSKLSKGQVKSFSGICKPLSKKGSGSSLDPKTLPDVDLDCDFINPTTERHLEKYTHGSLKSKLDNYGNWKCPICYYKTQDKTKYERHLREHLRRKTYCCRHCSYRTVIHQSFVVHLRKHSGVRPYKCLFCDYAATQRGNLDAHVRKHYNS